MRVHAWELHKQFKRLHEPQLNSFQRDIRGHIGSWTDNNIFREIDFSLERGRRLSMKVSGPIQTNEIREKSRGKWWRSHIFSSGINYNSALNDSNYLCKWRGKLYECTYAEQIVCYSSMVNRITYLSPPPFPGAILLVIAFIKIIQLLMKLLGATCANLSLRNSVCYVISHKVSSWLYQAYVCVTDIIARTHYTLIPFRPRNPLVIQWFSRNVRFNPLGGPLPWGFLLLGTMVN